MGREDDVKKAEEALKAAYRAESRFSAGPEWQAGVMRHIRSIETLKASTDETQVFGRLIWRFAATTGVFSAILLLYAINAGVGPENMLANIVLSDPAGFITSQLMLP